MTDRTEIDPELQQLLSSARRAAHRAVPQPSAAMAARLGRAVTTGNASLTDPRSSHEQLQGVAPMPEPIARFSTAAKVVVATAVLALGLTGVGAAGALPGPVQDTFDSVVSTIIPAEDEAEVVDDGTAEECTVDDGTVEDGTDEGTVDDGTAEDELYGTTDDGTVDDGTEDGTDDGTVTDECADSLPVGSGEFSDWVKQGAQDPNKVGSEFGAAVSEQARELKNEKAEERAANAGDNGNGNGQGGGGDDADDEGDEGSVDESPDGSGKPAGTPGGRP